MAKTRANLATRALQKLLVVGSGQLADSEDVETADGAIDAVLADLAGRNVYSVADETDIEVSAFEWLALILADTIAPDFGQPMDPNKRAYAENMLRRLTVANPTYEVHKMQYF
jgi:hypothetical protein